MAEQGPWFFCLKHHAVETRDGCAERHRLGPYDTREQAEHAVQDAGAFAVVMEMVPAEIAGQVTKELTIPTIGIGAGPDCDAQVLVWPDMAGLNGGRVPKFVKKYADLRGELLRAAQEYAADVRGGVFPGPEHSFE